MAEQDEVRRIKPGGIRGSQEQEPEQEKPEPKGKAPLPDGFKGKAETTQSAKRGNSAGK